MAISALESEIDALIHAKDFDCMQHHLPKLCLNLGETYSVKMDYVNAIKTYEKASEAQTENMVGMAVSSLCLLGQRGH